MELRPAIGVTIRFGGRAPPRALTAALAALAATLAAGLAGPALPGAWSWLMPRGEYAVAGLATIGGAGLLAWHLARMSAVPVRAGKAALAAAIAPLLLVPGIGAGALIVPAAIALDGARRDRGQRVVALMVHCGAAAALAALAAGLAAAAPASVIVLISSWVAALRSCRCAANDNPSMERVVRIADDSKLPPRSCYANRDSIPGKWGVSDV